MFSKPWGVISPKAAKAAIMLEMLQFMTKSTSSQIKGELMIINDNKLLNADIQGKW